MRRMMSRMVGLLLFIFVVLAVAWGLTNDPVDEDGRERARAAAPAPEGVATEAPLRCSVAGRAALPGDLDESSGVAVDEAAGMLWSHNDSGGDPVLYATEAEGRLAARVAAVGASNVDWEDIEIAGCGDGTCLFIADIGDNDAEREHITVYRADLPSRDMDRIRVTPLHARYPDGPRDAEALIATPDGRLHIVTKGRRVPIELYELPGADSEMATLRRVRVLGPEPDGNGGRVTAGAASSSGRWIAIRTYDELRVYEAETLLAGGDLTALTYDLRHLREPQGEGVDIQDDGAVWLTSERGGGTPPGLIRLDCTLPG